MGRSFLSVFYFLMVNYFSLCWIFLAAGGLSPVARSRLLFRCGAQASHYGAFSCCTGFRAPCPWSSRSSWAHKTYGIFRDRRLHQCPLHWRADSQPLHYRSPEPIYLLFSFQGLALISLLLNKKASQ